MGNKVKVGVKVMPREVILDTQGRAVEQILKLRQFSIQSCRVGKYVELELDGTPPEALLQAQQIAKDLLCNPLIEQYEVMVL